MMKLFEQMFAHEIINWFIFALLFLMQVCCALDQMKLKQINENPAEIICCLFEFTKSLFTLLILSFSLCFTGYGEL